MRVNIKNKQINLKRFIYFISQNCLISVILINPFS